MVEYWNMFQFSEFTMNPSMKKIGILLAVSSIGVSAYASEEKTQESSREETTVTVTVPCAPIEKTPVKTEESKTVTVKIKGYDSEGRPLVDKHDLEKQLGNSCRMNGAPKIKPEGKKHNTATHMMVQKLGAGVASFAHAAGKTGLAQRISGLVGIYGIGTGNPEVVENSLFALGGAFSRGVTGETMNKILNSRTPEEVDRYVGIIDSEQDKKFAMAEAQFKEAYPILIRGERSGNKEAAWRSYAAAVKSVKFPSGAKVYSAMIEEEARKKGIDPDILKAMALVESGFNPNAVSHVGARGLIQIMPGTAKGLNFHPDDMFNPRLNIRAAAEFVRRLKVNHGLNSIEMLAAAYNAGPGAVKRYKGIPPYKETINHVRKVSNAFYALKGGAGSYAKNQVKTSDAKNPIRTSDVKNPIKTSDVVFFGDSISDGFKRVSGGQGTTQVGASPATVLKNINMAGDSVAGKTVYLSSGLSNNTSDYTSIQKQISTLKRNGVKDVILMGVANNYKGSSTRGAEMNQRLAELASQNGVSFLGGFNAADSDKVHPKYNIAYLGN